MQNLTKPKLLILLLVATPREEELLLQAKTSISLACPTAEILVFQGASSMEEAFKLRARVVADLPEGIADYIMWMDPDDVLDIRGFPRALEELSPEGLLLKQQRLDEPIHTLYCCKVILSLEAAKELSPRTLGQGWSDRQHARRALREFQLPKSSMVAYRHRPNKEYKLPNNWTEGNYYAGPEYSSSRHSDRGGYSIRGWDHSHAYTRGR